MALLQRQPGNRRSRNYGSPAVTAREKGARGVNRTAIAFGIRALAQLLTVPLQKQVRAFTRFEVLPDLRCNGLLCFPIGHAIILALLTALDPNKHVWAIGRNCCNRRDTGE